MALGRARKNKQERKARDRLIKARRLAFSILDTQQQLGQVVQVGDHATSSELIARLTEQIDAEKEELRRLGYDVTDTLAAAAEYRTHLADEGNSPKPSRNAGVGAYDLGQKPKFWS